MDQSVSHVRVEQLEEALSEVAEIKAARVVVSPEGVIQEVHVLALPTKAPKQLVRDIESTIMARFGIPIDHKKISIAQLGADSVPKADERPSVVRPRIQSINAMVAGLKATATVGLEIDGGIYLGEADGAASQTGRNRLVAQATLDAVGKWAGDTCGFALEDVSVVQLGREKVAVACIALVSALGEQTFSGSALVRQNEND
ncbi:MAG: hypothetical protein Q8K99_09980, partial [Actinomycetota bacterium]|nr:hypothetical protein [Actinomycetota bacterium]